MFNCEVGSVYFDSVKRSLKRDQSESEFKESSEKNLNRF